MRYHHLQRVGILLILTGLILVNPYVIIPGILLLFISLLSWYWTHHLLKSVSCTFTLNEDRAKIGDTITGSLMIKNDQPFPIPSLLCTLDWPGELGLESGGLISHYRANRSFFYHTISLLWFQRVIKKLEIKCQRRGEYFIGPLDLSTTDPFGFQTGKKRIQFDGKLIIYPRILKISVHPLPHKGPFGEKIKKSFIFEDPTRFKGIREYRPMDPFSRIEWKATARSQGLKTKMVDASMAIQVALVINTMTGEYPWQMDQDLLERTLITGASLLCHFCQLKYRFGIYLNGLVRGSREPAAVPIGSGLRQLHFCIEVLGRILPSSHIRFEKILKAIGNRLGEDCQLIILTGSINQRLEREIIRQRRQGRMITIILTQHPDSVVSSLRVPIYLLKEEETWDELQQITLHQISS